MLSDADLLENTDLKIDFGGIPAFHRSKDKEGKVVSGIFRRFSPERSVIPVGSAR